MPHPVRRGPVNIHPAGWSGGWAYGGSGKDVIPEDATSTANMDGGRGPDSCTGGDTTTRCES